jgi:hypothetical protein
MAQPMIQATPTDAALTGRRRVPRRIFESPIGVLLHGTFTVQTSFQVGEGGMMISSAKPLVEGERLVISFFLPGSAMIVVRSIVRSVVQAKPGQSERYGMEFENLGFQHKREIRNFVAAATRSEGYSGL